MKTLNPLKQLKLLKKEEKPMIPSNNNLKMLKLLPKPKQVKKTNHLVKRNQTTNPKSNLNLMTINQTKKINQNLKRTKNKAKKISKLIKN